MTPWDDPRNPDQDTCRKGGYQDDPQVSLAETVSSILKLPNLRIIEEIAEYDLPD
jgi:hypothetical protein